jgi:hypothetical protein
MTLIATFFGGILVGLEVCAHYGFHAPVLVLDEKSQIVFRQGAVRRLRWLVPAFFVPTFLAIIALAIMGGTGSGFVFRGAAAAALLTWIIVRAIGTVPINAATLDWNPEQPPTDWKKKIEKAERFHVIATWAAAIAFICLLVSLGQPLN